MRQASILHPSDATIECFGARIAVSGPAAVVDAFVGAFESLGGRPSDEAGDVTYRVQRDGDELVARAEAGHEGAPVLLRADGPAALAAAIVHDAHRSVAVHARRGLFVHAGVVGWRGAAIVVPGRSFSGKTTLVAELVRCGATYLSDEFGVFTEHGTVLPYRRRLAVRDRVGALTHVDAASLGATSADVALPLGLVVATRYVRGTRFRPEIVRGVRAVLPLVDNTVLARHQPRRMTSVMARLAPTAVLASGPRGEADEEAAAVLELADQLVGAAPAGGEQGDG